MKIINVISKSLKEQLRNFWILLLTVSLAPFFVFIYYLITEAGKPQYDLIFVNNDAGVVIDDLEINKGNELILAAEKYAEINTVLPLSVVVGNDKTNAVRELKNKNCDALIIIPPDFSLMISRMQKSSVNESIVFEFIGDVTNINYMVSAIWGNEILNQFVTSVTGKVNHVIVNEESLGVSGQLSDFELTVPGLLILAIIMLMLSATIAIITEVENKTMLRLKLSRLNAFEFLTGVGAVQILVGIISILLTLLTAIALGFSFHASYFIFLLIAVITSISIIAFSLILAACTKSSNEVLIVGNFPLFLFMFFTGAAFPIQGKELFSILGYPVTLQGFMSPTHAIAALNKLLIMDMNFSEVLPEIVALIITTLIYFVIGVWAFNRRHMRVE